MKTPHCWEHYCREKDSQNCFSDFCLPWALRNPARAKYNRTKQFFSNGLALSVDSDMQLRVPLFPSELGAEYSLLGKLTIKFFSITNGTSEATCQSPKSD